jgi:glycerol-3-phosphate dehydrogenase
MNDPNPNDADTDAVLRPTVEALRKNPHCSVLIIGGGINGVGTFRDLALQGVDVVLVERGDYCSGASAASSHMIHGGIRYLENGELRLVRESVRERNRLLKLAPHYVKPLKTTVPIFSLFSGILSAPLRLLLHRQGRPRERGAALIKIGLTLYDLFSRAGGAVPRHQFRRRTEALRELPELNPKIRFTASYYDAAIENPERLALDVLFDGLAAGDGARSANYVEAIGSSDTGIILHDRASGTRWTMAADVVVNASGPWTDETNRALGRATSHMGGTKGSHIVLNNPELLRACHGREIFFENSDARIVLIYPLHGRVLVGTTDIDARPEEEVVCTEQEIDYFLDLISHVFPGIPVDRADIVFSYAGIRPLPRHDDVRPGFVSRDYRIVRSTLPDARTPLLSLVGGKWTTFRALSEHLAGDVLQLLGLTRRVETGALVIGGGTDFPSGEVEVSEWLERHRGVLSRDRMSVLLARYGTRAADLAGVLANEGPSPDGIERFTAEEVRMLCEREQVVHLTDLVLRRTNLAFFGKLTMATLEQFGDVAAKVLGWTPARRADEVADVLRFLATAHARVAGPFAGIR